MWVVVISRLQFGISIFLFLFPSEVLSLNFIERPPTDLLFTMISQKFACFLSHKHRFISSQVFKFLLLAVWDVEFSKGVFLGTTWLFCIVFLLWFHLTLSSGVWYFHLFMSLCYFLLIPFLFYKILFCFHSSFGKDRTMFIQS